MQLVRILLLTMRGTFPLTSVTQSSFVPFVREHTLATLESHHWSDLIRALIIEEKV